MSTETATIIMSLAVAIAISVALIGLSIYFGWFGRFWSDASVSAAVALLVILAYPPAQVLPWWLHLAYWPWVYLCLHGLEYFIERTEPPRSEQSPMIPPTPAVEAFPVDDVRTYFDFEEVIG